MSFDLARKGENSSWSNAGWPEVLSLAEHYDWKPAGTGPPNGVKNAGWDGGYASNDGQFVAADDARRLADALERGLADDFKRMAAKDSGAKPAKISESQREDAFAKLAALASTMSFEIVKGSAKPSGKAKRLKQPKKVTAADSLDESMARQGISPDQIPGLLTALYSDPSREVDQPAWFRTDNGEARLAEFVAFCRRGAFRIR
jgi:hypothetical protein